MILIIIFYMIISCMFIYYTRKQWLLNPASLFVLTQLIFFIGLIQFTDMNIESDTVHLVINIVGMTQFIVAATLCNKIFQPSVKTVKVWLSLPYKRIESNFQFNTLISVIILTAILISFIYYYRVGYNLFIDQALSVVKGEDPLSMYSDIAGKRLDAYSGETYFAPGYTNQFKNVLLPLLVCYLYSRYFLLKKRRDLLSALILSPLSLIFLLGTGQRGAFAIMTLVMFIFFNASLTSNKKKYFNIILCLCFIAVFSFSSYLIGRSLSHSDSGVDFFKMLMALPERILLGNQEAAVVGFHYVYPLPTQYGMDWVNDLMNLLPFKTKSNMNIASEAYYILFGSDRGTAPISIWGSIWYNWGPIGNLVIPFIMGLIYQGLYIKFIKGPKTLFRTLIYSSITVYLGTWIAGGPDSLVNIGLVTIIILRIIEYTVCGRWTLKIAKCANV
jgi:hypothetical protein